MKFKLIIFIVLVFFCNEAKAQDPIFSQYFLIPETLNPAFTGSLVTGYTGIIHRTQWPNQNTQMNTDFGFINGPIGGEEGKLGLGLTVLNQHEVFTDYNYFEINAAFAYGVEINSDWKLRLGLEAGYGHKNYDFNDLIFEDEIDIGNGSIGGGGSVDPGSLNYSDNIDFLDISAGFLIYNDDAWLGASLKHLNTPDISFTESGNVPLNMFLSIQAGFSIPLRKIQFSSNDTNLLVTANYMRQSQYNRLDIGGALEFKPFIFGVIAATNPEGKSDDSPILTSVIPFVSFQLDRFVLGYSFGINTSGLGYTQGIHEISLTFQIGRGCPTCNNYLVKRPWGRNY
jgi:type IX secretion system PorP/SprF family membrane protein